MPALSNLLREKSNVHSNFAQTRPERKGHNVPKIKWRPDLPLADMYLISEKPIWKNQVRRTGFLVYFELDFYCLCSLQKSISKLSFPTWFFKIQVQINRGLDWQNLSNLQNFNYWIKNDQNTNFDKLPIFFLLSLPQNKRNS